MEYDHTTVPISVILIPMIDSICSPDEDVFNGNLSGLVFSLNQIVNALELKLPSANIAVRIEDRCSEAIMFYHSKKFYDNQMREIMQQIPIDIHDIQLN